MQKNLTYLNTSANAACAILDLFPDSDLMGELRNLIHTQAYISNRMLIDEPLADDECMELSIYAKEVELEAMRLLQAQSTKRPTC